MRRYARLAAVGLLIAAGGCTWEEECDPNWECYDGDDEKCGHIWDDNVLEECNFNEFSGCWEWEYGRDCEEDGLVCRESGDNAACVAPNQGL
jgi:hypothetical protein